MKRIAATAAILLLANCVVPEGRAERILSGAGYTEIDLGGYAMFSCSEDDTLKRSFKAKGPTGQPVEGAVCCGIAVKNCTIRTD